MKAKIAILFKTNLTPVDVLAIVQISKQGSKKIIKGARIGAINN